MKPKDRELSIKGKLCAVRKMKRRTRDDNGGFGPVMSLVSINAYNRQYWDQSRREGREIDWDSDTDDEQRAEPAGIESLADINSRNRANMGVHTMVRDARPALPLHDINARNRACFAGRHR